MAKEEFAKKISDASSLAKKNVANEAKRLEEKIKTYNSSIKNDKNNMFSSFPENQSVNTNNKPSKNSDLKQKLQNKAGSAALQSVGLPKEAADGIMDFVQTEKGQKILKHLNKHQIGALGNSANKIMSKLLDSKQKDEQASEASGSNYTISKKAVKNVAIASIPALIALIFCCLFITATQVFTNAISLGTADSLSGEDVENKINKKGTDGLNTEKTDDDVAFDIYIGDYSSNNIKNIKLNNNVIQIASTKYLKRKYNEASIDSIEDFYPSVKDLSKNYDENMVYDFYFKLYNVYKAYRDDYDVYLDLPLIMATLNMQSSDKNVIFSSNLTAEDRKSTIRETHNEYDYYYDWSSYKVSKDKSEHDIELIAQHMVSVTSESGCTTKDGRCYEVNHEQYKEFLKEFLEKKYYIKSGGTIASNVGSPAPDGNTLNSNVEASSMAEQMIKIANQEYSSNGGAGDGYKYQKAFGSGRNVAWCAMFAWYVSSQTEYNGQKLYPDIIPFRSASTGEYMQLFNRSEKANINFYYNDSCSKLSGKNGNITYVPKPGDYIFFDWQSSFTDISQSGAGSGPQDHTALVEKYENGKIYTIEGNSSNTIKKLSYKISDCRIIGFGSWY